MRDRFKRNRFPEPPIDEPKGLALVDLYPLAGLIGLAGYFLLG